MEDQGEQKTNEERERERERQWVKFNTQNMILRDVTGRPTEGKEEKTGETQGEDTVEYVNKPMELQRNIT